LGGAFFAVSKLYQNCIKTPSNGPLGDLELAKADKTLLEKHTTMQAIVLLYQNPSDRKHATMRVLFAVSELYQNPI
jgi:hypothetical protein